jgi:uncharacterized protein
VQPYDHDTQEGSRVNGTGQGVAPPGWYHDGTALRWWDGGTWGPYAPAPVRDLVQEGKSMAVLSHFGFLACWFVLPLVLRVTAGRDNEYVRHHATEALNFMILATIVYVASLILMLSSIRFSTTGGFPRGFVLGELVVGLLQVGVAAFAIVGAVRASQGVWWRYPISIRFVPGARPRTA